MLGEKKWSLIFDLGSLVLPILDIRFFEEMNCSSRDPLKPKI